AQSDGFDITGSSQDDTITGSSGVTGIDHIHAGDGDDTIVGFTTGDTVDGQGDTDTITLSLAADATALAAAGDNDVKNCEEVPAGEPSATRLTAHLAQSDGFDITGSGHADIITGSSGVTGTDHIHAGDGDDTIVGFTTGDVVDGEGGIDTIT